MTVWWRAALSRTTVCRTGRPGAAGAVRRRQAECAVVAGMRSGRLPETYRWCRRRSVCRRADWLTPGYFSDHRHAPHICVMTRPTVELQFGKADCENYQETELKPQPAILARRCMPFAGNNIKQAMIIILHPRVKNTVNNGIRAGGSVIGQPVMMHPAIWIFKGRDKAHLAQSWTPLITVSCMTFGGNQRTSSRMSVMKIRKDQ